MKHLIYVFAILLAGCSGKGAFTHKEYKQKHLEFHQQQLDFIDKQLAEILINSQNLLDNLDTTSVLMSVDDNIRFNFLEEKWNATCQYINKLHDGNEIYLKSIIRNKASEDIWFQMMDENQKLHSYMNIHQVKTKEALMSGDMEAPKPIVLELVELCKTVSIKLKSLIQEYLKLCS